ncbi:hypothetical protein [Paenibacillus sp. A3]|uniref:hypothetical protein n=1 Tax=Paenibacillus sp. A3 TaxID=1337054 RepID=UPI0023562BF2|nr:hypothetical protein [Paenibacillus sp. A3]
MDGSFSEAGAKEAVYRLLAQQPDITALFCISDLMALGALQAVRGKAWRFFAEPSG